MTKRVALLFPGQGSQYVGMGKSLLGTKQEELFNVANTTLGYDLKKLMLEGPEEELTLTQNAQPAIVCYSLALFERLRASIENKKISVEIVMGHSVGEWSALAASNVMTLPEVLKAVHNRGLFMQKAVPAGQGKMYAILRAPLASIEEACRQASSDNDRVMPANYNEPSQVVISGGAAACDRAIEKLKELIGDQFKAMELKVSAPFHSSLMEPAAQKMQQYLHEIPFKPNQYPYRANIDGQLYPAQTDPKTIKSNLVKQIAGSVLWMQSFSQLQNIDMALEVGPGRVLAGLARKINPAVEVLSLDREETWKTLESL
jgi:[acyl-carrier-protein] S-malonyltransferase